MVLYGETIEMITVSSYGNEVDPPTDMVVVEERR